MRLSSKWVKTSSPRFRGEQFHKIFEKRHHPVWDHFLGGLPGLRHWELYLESLWIFAAFLLATSCWWFFNHLLPSEKYARLSSNWVIFSHKLLGWKFQKYLSCHHLGNHGCLQNWNNKKTEKQTYTEIHLSKGWSCTKNGCFWEFLLDFQIHYRSMYYIALTAEWHHSTRCQLLIQSTFWGNADKGDDKVRSW